jgi:hypothetical protein
MIYDLLNMTYTSLNTCSERARHGAAAQAAARSPAPIAPAASTDPLHVLQSSPAPVFNFPPRRPPCGYPGLGCPQAALTLDAPLLTCAAQEAYAAMTQ